MDLTQRPASLGGIEGALVGAEDGGMVWQAELEPERVASFLRVTAGGARLELRTEGGVTHAQVVRCWVDVGDAGLRLRIALSSVPVA
jgi:hypothetical protein